MKYTMSWQIAAASNLGRHHRLLGKNRQDALAYRVEDSAVVIAVTDGCGSAAHSEVGAYLGAKAAMVAMLSLQPDAVDFCDQVAAGVLAVIDPADDAFLFTLCGALVTPYGVRAFIFGDGIVAIDGQVHSFHAEAPDYLAYHSKPKPVFDRFVPSAYQVLAATDGVELDVLRLADESRHFSHPDALRRTLAKADCHDDATIVIARSAS